ncbi:BTAD domain-containing putative transcriptional regulator [Streptomyces nojiriensis]|uniref:BTAD domain-containing putative transcriptional regulator n=1 Tax=Streptomyces nojiriensis TaxID=66374 RepID=UPI0035DB46E5
MVCPTRKRCDDLLTLDLCRCGGRTESLGVYERAWQRLTSEADVGPEPPLRARMDSPLRRDPDTGAAVPRLSTVPDLPTASGSIPLTGLPGRRCLT